MTYGLTGLPPTPDEIESFLADEAPEAFSKVVDRLLASHHYGEQWARHWLDIVRYADSLGGTANFPFANAGRRDIRLSRLHFLVACQELGSVVVGRSDASGAVRATLRRLSRCDPPGWYGPSVVTGKPQARAA